MSSINVTVNPTIQKTIVTQVSPNQVISVDPAPSASYISSQTTKVVEVGAAAQNLTEYVKHSETGALLDSGAANLLYYPISNPSGYATGVDASSLVSKSTFNAYTGKLAKFNAFLTSGVIEEYVTYPVVFSSSPVVVCEIENNMDNLIYNYHLKSVNISGFTIGYSDYLSSTGYKLHIEAQLL